MTRGAGVRAAGTGPILPEPTISWVSAAASVSLAAGFPAHGLTGNYIEARTADVLTGPCFANGEVEMNGKEAVFGWKINNGNWRGVSLEGLSVVRSHSLRAHPG